MKSQVLGNTLLTLGCNETTAVAIVNIWTTESAALIHKLRHRLLGTPQILTNSAWQILLTMGNGSTSSSSVPTASLELTLSTNPDNSIPSTIENTNRNLTLDFTNNQLLTFLENMDTIQSQLDSLS